MAEEPKQATAPGGAPRREGGHGGGHGGPGGGHGGPRREGGPGGGGPGGAGGPGGRPRGKRQYFRKKKVCKFCVEKMEAGNRRGDESIQPAETGGVRRAGGKVKTVLPGPVPGSGRK